MNARDSLRSSRPGALHRPTVIDAHALTRSTLTRHRGGIFSPTVDRIHTLDGALRTDLVRLSPDVDAYSLDAHAESPRDLAHYRVTSWQGGASPALREVEKAVVWILVNSYPTLDTSTLSSRLRGAGYDIGRGDIPIPEAIAATQAALWTVTSGILPDRGDEEAITTLARHARAEVRGFRTGPDAPLLLPVHLPSSPRIGGYRLALTADGARVHTRLERSPDGVSWTEVPSSRADGPSGIGMRTIRKGLGAGATVAGTVPGAARGYPHYRVRVATDAPALVRIHDIDLDLIGRSGRANSRRLLALYDHLSEGALQAGRIDAGPLIGPRSVLAHEDRPLGPFVIDPARVRAARVHATAGGAPLPLIDADGLAVRNPAPGTEFFVDPSGCGTSGRITMTVEIEHGWSHSGRILVGSSRGGTRRYTPLALVVREPVTGRIHREAITWRAPAHRVPIVAAAAAL